MSDIQGIRINVRGIVQGVGFRPFIYGLAKELELTGWVQNTSAGVDIELDGPAGTLDRFLEALNTQAPPLSKIDSITSESTSPNGFLDFTIVESQAVEGAFQPVSPDVSLCSDCAREMFDPEDRRFRYPFINCTNCGPRFTIIKDIPYDRPFTTMAPFEMCKDCEQEYHDPLNRRFHAQPVACSVCGPHVWLEIDGVIVSEKDAAIVQARNLLREKKILAVKGLGGFHLACDATDPGVVSELRHRKMRVDKAFAVMMPNIETVEENCELNEVERQLVITRERPIVVLDRHDHSKIGGEVAPGQNTIGVMLPYTPLHELLIEPEGDYPDALVMTSGNISEEPISTENVEANSRLGNIADAFLMHNRDIRTRCDDSVVREFDGEIYPLRRSRGYAPNPIHLKWEGVPILAAGGELKNAFCVSRGKYAFLSHHVGDMENFETLQSFEDGISHFERLFRITPEAIAYDLHPNYLATNYAFDRASRDGLALFGIQHHHAHIASCIAENGHPGDTEVIGVAFDGTGYGEDGAIWGGEVLVADYLTYDRVYHLSYVPMPGGDRAIREPWRVALAWIGKAGLDSKDFPHFLETIDTKTVEIVRQQIKREINSPLTSSMGRLFDAVASMIGIRNTVNYEAQAAIELEALIDMNEDDYYHIEILDGVIDPSQLIQSICADVKAGVSAPVISARFHNSITRMVNEVCMKLRELRGISEVALSGGVWQNMALLEAVVHRLRKGGFTVYIQRQVPANDGGVALGQLAIAHHQLGLLG
jgi:hydrogenase maturation protein HypF